MKLRVPLLALTALAGVGASYALADEGHGDHGPGSSCQRAHLLGTIAPQTLTVTVAKSGPDGVFTVGQTVTVSIGSNGQLVRVNVGGCSNGSSLTANEAELHALLPPPPGPGRDGHGRQGDGDHPAGTQSTTTTTTTTAGHDAAGDHPSTTQSTSTTATTTTTTGR